VKLVRVQTMLSSDSWSTLVKEEFTSPEARNLVRSNFDLFVGYLLASCKRNLSTLDLDRFESILALAEVTPPFFNPQLALNLILGQDESSLIEEKWIVSVSILEKLIPRLSDQTKPKLLRKCLEFVKNHRCVFSAVNHGFVCDLLARLVHVLHHLPEEDTFRLLTIIFMFLSEFFADSEPPSRLMLDLAALARRVKRNVLDYGFQIKEEDEERAKLGFGLLFHLNLHERALLPRLYPPEHVFRAFLPSCAAMLAQKSPRIVEQALSVLKSFDFARESLGQEYAELEELSRVFSALFKVMCFREEKSLRVNAKMVFEAVFSSLDPSGKTLMLGTLFMTERQPSVREYLVLEAKRWFLKRQLDVGHRGKVHRLLFALFGLNNTRKGEEVNQSAAFNASWLIPAMGFLRVLSREPHRSAVSLSSILDPVRVKFVEVVKKSVKEAQSSLNKDLHSEEDDEEVEMEVKMASGENVSAPKGERKKERCRLGLTAVALLEMSLGDLEEDLCAFTVAESEVVKS
jgi:hypothetical protein